MASHTEMLKIKTKRDKFYDITDKIQEIVRRSGVEDGICNIFAVGSTAGVLINEYEPMLMNDILNALNKIAPSKKLYHHPDNAISHIKAALVGPSRTVSVDEGKVSLGTWQQILLINFDTSDRERTLIVTVIGD